MQVEQQSSADLLGAICGPGVRRTDMMLCAVSVIPTLSVSTARAAAALELLMIWLRLSRAFGQVAEAHGLLC